MPNIICCVCGKTFYVKPSRADGAKYCSMNCYGVAQKKLWENKPREPKCIKPSIPNIPLVCGTCHKPFNSLRADAKYCSRECYYVAQKGQPRKTPVYKVCEVCGKTFRIKPVHAGVTKYCSIACKNLSMVSKVSMTCKECGKPFEVPKCRKSTAYFCSISCGVKWRNDHDGNPATRPEVKEKISRNHADISGERHPNWKGGRHREKIRRGARYRDRARRIALRDKTEATCALCGVTYPLGKGLIHVHHIDKEPSNNSPENLLIVCTECHYTKLHPELRFRYHMHIIPTFRLQNRQQPRLPSSQCPTA